MGPQEALRVTGKRAPWVAQQMGVSRSYLWRLVRGERSWTRDLERSFALALGMAPEAISFFGGGLGTTPT